MTVTVPQDGIGLANLYGGTEALAARMDTILQQKVLIMDIMQLMV